MKSKLAALTLLTFAFSCKMSKNKVYTIIKPGSQRLEKGILDTTSLNSLSEPMKAVAYLYFSGKANAELATEPQSAAHLSLVSKYFPTDRLTDKTKSKDRLRKSLLASQNNYFTSLRLIQEENAIIASYTYDVVHDGQILSHSNEDVFTFDGKTIKSVE